MFIILQIKLVDCDIPLTFKFLNSFQLIKLIEFTTPIGISITDLSIPAGGLHTVQVKYGMDVFQFRVKYGRVYFGFAGFGSTQRV